MTATNIESGDITKFSNRDAQPLTVDHVLASGSLPPGFPMTAIGDSLYWDGGLFDNTPLSQLMGLIPNAEEAARTRLFVVNLFPKKGKIPRDMLAVSDRIVELIFANKMSKDVEIAKIINRFVNLVEKMTKKHRELGELLKGEEYKELARFKALSDIVEITNTREEPVSAASDFSRESIEARIAAGYRDADWKLKESRNKPAV